MTATPAFFWYPLGATTESTLETTDLEEALSALEEEPILQVEDLRSVDGAYSATVAGTPRLAVRIALERFTSTAVAYKLLSLQSILECGWAVGFCADQSKAWAGFCASPPTRGDVSLSVGLAAFPGSGTLAAGDWICVESLGTEGRREWVKVSSTGTGTITLDPSTPIVYNHDGATLVRHRDYYPVLVWPSSRRRQPIVTTTRRINWTLDLTLETEPNVVAAYYEDTGGYQDGLVSATANPSKMTYQHYQHSYSAIPWAQWAALRMGD